MKRTLLITLCILSFLGLAAQENNDQAAPARKPVYKVTFGASLDGAILSTAHITSDYPTSVDKWGTWRFTYFFNFGTTVHRNLTPHFGVYTGLDLKNVGFIEKLDGLTVKRRTYNVGIPLGLKFGNMEINGSYGFAGFGIDIPINYKEKSYTRRSDKDKFNEWFSDRTPIAMPYVFAGFAVRHGITLKAQYYLNNFLNPNFTRNGIKPYDGYNVHLLLFSVGVGVPGTRRHSAETIN